MFDFKSIPDKQLNEPNINKVTSSGIIIIEDNKNVWVRKISNNYGGFFYSFAKGKLENNLSLQQNAIKEVYEEMGFICDIHKYLFDLQGYTTITRYYLGDIVHNIGKFDFETEYIVLVPIKDFLSLINEFKWVSIMSQRDILIMNKLYKMFC